MWHVLLFRCNIGCTNAPLCYVYTCIASRFNSNFALYCLKVYGYKWAVITDCIRDCWHQTTGSRRVSYFFYAALRWSKLWRKGTDRLTRSRGWGNGGLRACSPKKQNRGAQHKTSRHPLTVHTTPPEERSGEMLGGGKKRMKLARRGGLHTDRFKFGLD